METFHSRIRHQYETIDIYGSRFLYFFVARFTSVKVNQYIDECNMNHSKSMTDIIILLRKLP